MEPADSLTRARCKIYQCLSVQGLPGADSRATLVESQFQESSLHGESCFQPNAEKYKSLSHTHAPAPTGWRHTAARSHYVWSLILYKNSNKAK